MAAKHQGERLPQVGQQHRGSPSILLSPYRNGEPLAAGRAECCILKYPVLSPIHFYSQSENNLPCNNTDTHSTAPGTHPAGHDAMAQASPEVRGEPQPGELCPFSIPWDAPTPSCCEHNLACGWRNLCTVLVCVPPTSLPPWAPHALLSPTPPCSTPLGASGHSPPPRPPSAPPSGAGVGGLYSMAVRSPGPGALVLSCGAGGQRAALPFPGDDKVLILEGAEHLLSCSLGAEGSGYGGSTSPSVPIPVSLPCRRQACLSLAPWGGHPSLPGYLQTLTHSVMRHSSQATKQHQWNLQLQRSLRVCRRMLCPRPQHRLSQLSMPGLVLLHRRP